MREATMSRSILFVALLFAAAVHAYLPPDIQMRMGIPGLNHVEVISTQRNNSTIQAFLDEFMAGDTGWEVHEGIVGEEFKSNALALQKCLVDPQAEGFFLWLNDKLNEGGDVNDCEFKDGEILVKAVQFLVDGHVIYCLSTRADIGDYEQRREKTLMEKVKNCVQSQLGYIGGAGSPRVSNLAEFLVQMEEHQKHGHWELRRGTYNGSEMTAREFVGAVLREEDEKWGKSDNVFIGHKTNGIDLRCNGREYEFHFMDKIEDGERKFFSTSFDADAQ